MRDYKVPAEVQEQMGVSRDAKVGGQNRLLGES